MDRVAVQERTGALFGDLWRRYDDQLFDESVDLFRRRFEANGFNLEWFRSKKCLDVGCGGGRYSIAMARLGASEVIGADISIAGLADASRRAAAISNVSFEEASVLDLPFEDSKFDFVCCSGVLHHTPDPERGLRELVRVLRPDGILFLLVYGKGGLRWPTIMKIRSPAQAIGYDLINDAMRLTELPANKQRTFLDDLFVPIINFYDWDQVEAMLKASGVNEISRWEQGKLDHESSVDAQRLELRQLQNLFEKTLKSPEVKFVQVADHLRNSLEAVTSALARLDAAEMDYTVGKIDDRERQSQIFGWGHHRVLATKR